MNLERLFVYGTLGLGQPNEHILSRIGGKWENGYVIGELYEEGWGAQQGYPGIRLTATGQKVEGYLFSSDQLHGHWEALDDFEGVGYERVPTTITLTETRQEIEAFIYVLR